MKFTQLFLAGTTDSPEGLLIHGERTDVTNSRIAEQTIPIIVPNQLDHVFMPLISSSKLTELFKDQVMDQLHIAAKICKIHVCSGGRSVVPNKNGIFLVIRDFETNKPCVFYAVDHELSYVWEKEVTKKHGVPAYYFSITDDRLGRVFVEQATFRRKLFEKVLTMYLCAAMETLGR